MQDRAGQGRAGGRARGQGRAGQGRAQGRREPETVSQRVTKVARYMWHATKHAKPVQAGTLYLARNKLGTSGLAS